MATSNSSLNASARRRAVSRSARGWPPEHRSVWRWIEIGFAKQPWGMIVALIASWTGLAVAIWAAPLGALLGGAVFLLVSFLAASGTLLQALFGINLGAWVGAIPGFTIVGVVVSTALGGLAGLGLVYGGVLFHDPAQILVALVAGTLFSGALVALFGLTEPFVLHLLGYRRMSIGEARRVRPLLEEVVRALNARAQETHRWPESVVRDLEALGQKIPRPPDLPLVLPYVLIADRGVPRAWTHLRAVVLTSALLAHLDDEELAGVLAHELHHWRSGDSIALTCVWAGAFPVTTAYTLGRVLDRWARQSQHRFIASMVHLVGVFFLWPALVLVQLAIVPAVAAATRAQEYAADAAAGNAGYGPALARALRKIAQFEGGRTGWEAALAATHPPTALRIERLEPSDEMTPEVDPGEVSQTAVVTAAAILLVVVLAAGKFVSNLLAAAGLPR